MNKEGLLKRVDDILDGKADGDFLALGQDIMMKLAEIETAARTEISEGVDIEKVKAVINSLVLKVIVFVLLTAPIITRLANSPAAPALCLLCTK